EVLGVLRTRAAVGADLADLHDRVRQHFLAAGALDDAGGEAVAGDHRAALGDHDVDASLLEPGTVENAEAGALAARARDPALAEGVITADVQGQVLRHARAPLLEEFHQSAEV